MTGTPDMAEVVSVGPLLMTIENAATAMAMSRRGFEDKVLPHIAIVRITRRPLVPVAELQRFIEANQIRPSAAISRDTASRIAQLDQRMQAHQDAHRSRPRRAA